MFSTKIVVLVVVLLVLLFILSARRAKRRNRALEPERVRHILHTLGRARGWLYVEELSTALEAHGLEMSKRRLLELMEKLEREGHVDGPVMDTHEDHGTCSFKLSDTTRARIRPRNTLTA